MSYKKVSKVKHKRVVIMKMSTVVGLLVLSGIVVCGISVYSRKQSVSIIDRVCNIKTSDDVLSLFPTSVTQLEKMATHGMEHVKKQVQTIIDLPDEQRTFANTALALDRCMSFSDLRMASRLCTIVRYLYPEKEMRDAAYKISVGISDFYIDTISSNKKLFNALRAYVDGNASTEQLNAEQRYFLTETMDDFVRAGLNLPDDELERVKALQKEITTLTLSFTDNVAQDSSTIELSADEVVGMNPDFLASCKRTEQGNYILGTDYPTRSAVLEKCANADARLRYFTMVRNIAYPKNNDALTSLLQKRDQLAHLLGFESYAHLDTVDQMIKTPERAYAFLRDVRARAAGKAQEERERWFADLPPSVVLTDDGRINAWDTAYLLTYYKEKYLKIDEQEIAQYFPMQETVDGLLDVYHRFLSINFKQVPVSGLWDPEVTLIEVTDADKQLMGYLFLDLYPRANKFNHAAHALVVPAVIQNGKRIAPAVGVVMANFPKPTATKPALLKRNDVVTFFHEFGHALHALCGATEMASFSGTLTKGDFIELPSQILEEWLRDKEVLRMVSKHYQTGEPLPDALIDRIINLKTYNAGSMIMTQSFLALISLEYHAQGEYKDVQAQWESLFKETCPYIRSIPEDHAWASFGHLVSYASKYYGYLWSEILAQDVFECIKKEGLLNPVVGQRYIKQVIGKGGSEDPNELLRTFLGREPRSDAFFKSLGLSV